MIRKKTWQTEHVRELRRALQILVLSKAAPKTHYPAVIVKTRESHGRYSHNYYATVVLTDGSVKTVDITESAYRDIKDREKMVVCVRQAPLGIRFISLHAPE